MSDRSREVRLGDIATITIGRTPPRNDPSYWTSDLARPFCTIADMQGGGLIDPQREGVTAKAEAEGKAKRVPAGSLLLSFKLTIGRVGVAARDLFPNEAIAWLEPSIDDVDRRFLALALESQNLGERAGRAVKGKTLNSVSLRTIQLALPPIDEQRRIVGLVDAADAYGASITRAIKAASQARSALAREWFRSGKTPSVALNSVARITQGNSLPLAISGTKSGPISWFKISDMTSPENEYGYSLAATCVSRDLLEKRGARLLPAGSVALPRVGAAVRTEKKRMLLTEAACDENHLAVIPGPDLVPGYLLAFLEATSLSDIVQSGAVPSLNQDLINNLRIPVHPSPFKSDSPALLTFCGLMNRWRQGFDDLLRCSAELFFPHCWTQFAELGSILGDRKPNDRFHRSLDH
ncbi:MAG TPA: restriction endonuclease subunit S [Candidatus Dormibacteraeota bacterium]